MKLRRATAVVAGLAALAAAPSVSAHFILLQPASAIEENQLGDPQKLRPCGGATANPKLPIDTAWPGQSKAKGRAKVKT